MSVLANLREVNRYFERARRILLTQGAAGLFRNIKQHTGKRPVNESPKPRLIELTEPLAPLVFERCEAPIVSVIVTFSGNARLTYRCMAALRGLRSDYPFEIVFVHAGSGDWSTGDARLWKNVLEVVAPGPLATAAERNWAATRARGDFLVFLDDRTQVLADWLDALIETFDLRDDAGIVGSRLLSPEGRILDLGGVVLSDGTLGTKGLGEDSQRPEYSHLRRVDYCSGDALAIRHSLFHDLNGFDVQFERSSYMDVDLAFRARIAGYSAYCQPQSEVIHATGNSGEEGRPGSSNVDEVGRARFLRRWAGRLRDTVSAPTRHAFVSDFDIPMPDRDSGSLRMARLLTILQEQQVAVTFASMGLQARQPYLSQLQKQGIECLYRPYERSCAEHLRRHGNRYDLIFLSRLDTAAELLAVARHWCPRARIVFDTVDLHFQRIAREGDIRNDSRIRRRAERTKRLELDLVRRADTTLVVSEAEKALLAEEVPGADVRVLSNIHQVTPTATPFEYRQHILFIGGFNHPPNTDAVIYFCRNMFPRIAQALPGVRFYVIGSDPPPEVSSLASKGVRILGYVRDVGPYWRECRLSVAPLRFGAGVKGKINQSLAHGVPVVVTSIAAEGMFLENGRSALIADGPDAFADAVVRLYEDKSLWYRLSQGGIAVIEDRFSFSAARAALSDLLGP